MLNFVAGVWVGAVIVVSILAVTTWYDSRDPGLRVKQCRSRAMFHRCELPRNHTGRHEVLTELDTENGVEVRRQTLNWR